MSIEDYRNKIFEWLEHKPTSAQLPIHESDARIKLVAGGERGGKSVVGAKEAVIAAGMSRLIWIVAPEYDIARTEFEYCLNDFNKIGFLSPEVSFPKQGPCSFKLRGTKEEPGCEVVTKSAKEPQKLGMEAPDFILGCEAAQMEYEAYMRLRGRIAEKRAKMVLTGTFEGSIGWYPELYTRWQGPNEEDAKSFSLPSWSNILIYPGGRDDPEIKKLEAETPKDLFMERYAGVPCKPSGIVLPEFSNLIHVSEELTRYNPDIPVEIAVDPGSGIPGAYAVLAIQIIEGTPRLIAEKYMQGYVTEDVIVSCEKDWTPWFRRITKGVIDIAGIQKHGMPAPIKQWQEQSGIYLESSYVPVEYGIEQLRTFLKVHPETGKPGMYVNPSCKGFIAECGGGKSPAHGGGPWLRDLNTGKASVDNCHSTKAFAYWIVKRFGYNYKEARDRVPYGTVFGPDNSGRMVAVRR